VRVLPLIFVTALVGLDVLIKRVVFYYQRKDAHLAKRVFGTGVVGMALLVGGILYGQKALAEPNRRQCARSCACPAKWLGSEG
jgi:hypothetical protein